MKNTVKKLYSFFFLLLILFIYCITQKQPRNTHKQKFNGSLCHVLGKVEMHLEILSNNWKNPTTDSFSQSQGKKKTRQRFANSSIIRRDINRFKFPGPTGTTSKETTLATKHILIYLVVVGHFSFWLLIRDVSSMGDLGRLLI